MCYMLLISFSKQCLSTLLIQSIKNIIVHKETQRQADSKSTHCRM